MPDCPDCKGRGVVPDTCQTCRNSFTVTCFYCQGAGEKREWNTNGPYNVTCRDCSGKGTQPCHGCKGGRDQKWVICIPCEGSGKLTDERRVILLKQRIQELEDRKKAAEQEQRDRERQARESAEKQKEWEEKRKENLAQQAAEPQAIPPQRTRVKKSYFIPNEGFKKLSATVAIFVIALLTWGGYRSVFGSSPSSPTIPHSTEPISTPAQVQSTSLTSNDAGEWYTPAKTKPKTTFQRTPVRRHERSNSTPRRPSQNTPEARPTQPYRAPETDESPQPRVKHPDDPPIHDDGE